MESRKDGGFRGPTPNLRMARQVRYTPHPFIQAVSRDLDELIEAQSDLLTERYLSASEKWEIAQDAFEGLLASCPSIRECSGCDVKIFWTAVADAATRRKTLLWLQRSTRRSQGDHHVLH